MKYLLLILLVGCGSLPKDECLTCNFTIIDKTPIIWKKSITFNVDASFPNEYTILIEDVATVFNIALLNTKITINRGHNIYSTNFTETDGRNVIYMLGTPIIQWPGSKIGETTNFYRTEIMESDIVLNKDFLNGLPEEDVKVAYIYAVLLHEMGHALGLKHNPDPNSFMFARAKPELYWESYPLSKADIDRLGEGYTIDWDNLKRFGVNK